MDFWATKTRSEREQEEDERLVRRNPPDKPARHDLRRERVAPDVDPDADDSSDQKDRSRNYKRMAADRLIAAARQRAAKGERIPAKSRATGETVMISPNTLKDKPGEYEALEQGEEPKKPDAPEPEKPKAEEPQSKKDRDKFYSQAGSALRELAKTDPKVESKLKNFLDPKSQVSGMVQENPTFPAEKLFPGLKLPDGIKTISDVHEALLKAPAPSKGKGKKKPTPEQAEPAQERPAEPAQEQPAEAPAADAPTESAPAEPKPEAPAAEAPKGEPKPKKPKVPKEKKPEGGKPEEEAKPKTEAEKAGIAPPKRRPTNSAEREEALSLLVDTFPPEISAEFIAKNMHPDDVKALVRSYTAAQKVDPKSMDDVVKKASTFFQMDPDKVPPPAAGKNAAGEVVSFDDLTPEEQSETTRKHQLQIAAMSLAAKTMLTKQYEGKGGLTGKPRIPRNLASMLAHLVLSNAPADKVGEIATQVFDKTIEAGDVANISDKSARMLLAQVKGHPAARAAATAFLQANDYGQAKQKFLKGDDETLSEWQDPGTILKGLHKAGKYFEGRNALYGTDGETHPSAVFFRSRVMSRLRALDPKKARMVAAALPVLEEKEYKERRRQWEAKYKAWSSKSEAHGKAVEDYLDNPGKKKPPGQFTEPEPVEPVAPVTQDKKGEDVWSEDSFAAKAPAKAKTTVDKPVEGELAPAKTESGEVQLDDKERQEVAQSAEKMVGSPPKFDEEPAPEAEDSPEEKAPKEPSGEVELDDEERAAVDEAAEARVKNPPKLNGKQASDFTYPAAPVMGSASKTGVYHGVDPYAYGPAAYPGWLQPHQRDLGDADFKLILGLAQDWLKSPMLSVAVDGMVPDARYRAALDLAIYDSPYNRAINAGQYNQILAQLAGVPEPGPDVVLTTIRASHNFKTETRYILAHGEAPITGQVLSAVESEEFPFTDEDGKNRQGGHVAARVTRTVSAAEVPPAGQFAETVLRIDFPQGSEQAALQGVQAALAKFKLAAEKTTPGRLPQFRASTFSPSPSVPTGGSTSMKASVEIRKFAAEVAKSNSKLAFEMLASADRLAEEEKKMPPWLEKKIDDKDDGGKEDKGQQSKEASVKLGSLRALIIKQASGVDASSRGPWLPVLQALKDLG